jgi:hypothetical protein
LKPTFLYSNKGWSCYYWATRHSRSSFVELDHLSLAPCQLSVLAAFAHRVIDVYHSGGGEDNESCVDDAKHNHKDHGIRHILSPNSPRLSCPFVDHAKNEEAEDAHAYQGNIETYGDWVDGSFAAQKEQRDNLVHIRQNPKRELRISVSAYGVQFLVTWDMTQHTGKKDGMSTSTLVVGSDFQ